jgi:hypothetical protein
MELPEVKPAREGDFILIIVPHYWGKGETLADAARVIEEHGGEVVEPCAIFSVEVSTTVAARWYVATP